LKKEDTIANLAKLIYAEVVEIKERKNQRRILLKFTMKMFLKFTMEMTLIQI